MFPEFYEQKTELIENRNFCLFAEKGKRRRKLIFFVVAENGNGKRKFGFLE
jgi:hypothetical protein